MGPSSCTGQATAQAHLLDGHRRLENGNVRRDTLDTNGLVPCQEALHVAGDALVYWLVRFVIGPGLLATAALHQTWEAKVASILPGLLIVQGGNWVSERRRAHEERRRARAIKAREVESAHRRIVEVLIDAVTVFEAHRPKDHGRFRANVMLVEGDVLRMEYRTSGYTEVEEALEWHRGEGSAGRAWDRGQTVIAPTDDAPLPTIDEGSFDRIREYRSVVAERVHYRVGHIDDSALGVPSQLRVIASTLLIALINHEYQHSKWIGELHK